MDESCEVALVVRLWYPPLRPDPESGAPLISDDVYIPSPSFSAADRDKSIDTCSREVNFRKRGFAFTLLLLCSFVSGVEYRFACALAGMTGLAVCIR